MVSLKKQSHNRYQLIQRIVELSDSDSWREAKQEWCLVDVYRTQSLGECLCGHPIKEHCVLQNHENGNEAIVGSVCVKLYWFSVTLSFDVLELVG